MRTREMQQRSASRLLRAALHAGFGVFLVATVLSLSGCGSGSSQVAGTALTTSTTRSTTTGRAVFRIAWPARPTTSSRLIPLLANSIRVDVKSNGMTVVSQLLARPYPTQPDGQVGTLTFDAIPIGDYTVVATALPNTDGSGTAQATGNVPATVTANATTTFSLTMQSTIDHIALTATHSTTTLPTTLAPGDTLALTANAANASGSTVLTNLTWTATDPATGATSALVTLDSAGNVSALAYGTVTITAADPESGKSASTLVTIAAATGIASSYTATDIGQPPGGYLYYQGNAAINASGQVAAGWVINSFGTQGILLGISPKAFLYTPGVGFKDIGAQNGGEADALGLNDNGDVVGVTSNSTNINGGFLYHNGTMTSIGANGYAYAVNTSEQAVGTTGLTSGSHAALFVNRVVKDLGDLGNGSVESQANAISASGQIVGYATTESNFPHAFLYSGGVMNDLGTLYGHNSSANAINSSGQIVGASHGNTNYQCAFLYNNGTMTDIEKTAGVKSNGSTALGINDNGLVVGELTDFQTSQDYAFIYANGVLKNLNTIASGLNGTTLYSAVGITNNGLILCVGNRKDSDGDRFVVLTPNSTSKSERGGPAIAR